MTSGVPKKYIFANLGVPSHGPHSTLYGNYSPRPGRFFHCMPLIGWGLAWVILVLWPE